jgi:hypothetical protein
VKSPNNEGFSVLSELTSWTGQLFGDFFGGRGYPPQSGMCNGFSDLHLLAPSSTPLTHSNNFQKISRNIPEVEEQNHNQLRTTSMNGKELEATKRSHCIRVICVACTHTQAKQLGTFTYVGP